VFKIAKPFFIICETSLHCGSGNDIGIVDLPIQRERHTNFPKIEASSIKGGIREAFEESDEEKEIDIGNNKVKIADKDTISLVFGPDAGSDHAGALGFSDARLLLFPVKSMKGVFAWVTCPQILERFRNDLKLCGSELPLELPKGNTAPNECALFIKNNKIVFEEYTFEIKMDADRGGNCTKLANWLSQKLFPTGGTHKFWIDKVKKDIVVLSDDDFRDFVTLSTEVITRIKINNETGTVQPGALFTEEYLPAETILYSLALTTPIFKEDDNDKGIFKQTDKKEEELVMEFFENGLPEIIQLGGNATIGKGIVRTRVLEVENA